MSRWLAVVPAFAVLAGLVGLVAVPAARAGQLTVFRSGVDLVTVDVSVHGADGRPVEGLGPEDFALKVDGRPRRVVSAQFISHPPAAARSAGRGARHYSSNERADAGRFVVIAVDQRHIRRLEGTAALRAAAAFVDALDPADLVAVVSLQRPGPLVATTDRHAARRAIERLVGEGEFFAGALTIGVAEALFIAEGHRAKLDEVVRRECGVPLGRLENPRRLEDINFMRDPCPVQIEQEARALVQQVRTETGLSVKALTAIVERLKDREGPKTLVLLSEGLIAEPQLFDFAELAAAAQAAQVAVYVLQLEMPVFEAAQDRLSPSAAEDDRLRTDGLARLAGAARGALFRIVGSDPSPFERIAREFAGHYLLAFEAEPGDRDGRLHRIHVSLARGGGALRARSAFRLDPPAAGPEATPEDALVQLLRQTRLATELPLRVATFVYREPGAPRFRVAVSAEAETGAGAASGATIGFVVLDERQVIVASGAAPADGGRRTLAALLPPGRYTLKVAAIDRLGRRGSVVRAFVAGLPTSGGLEVSDLMLAEPAPAEGVPLRPVVDRAPSGALVAYLELYGRPTLALDSLRVHVRVTDEQTGAVVAEVPAAVTRGGRSWAIARAELAIGDLAPGSYTAHAVVSVAERTVARASRSFTVSARPTSPR